MDLRMQQLCDRITIDSQDRLIKDNLGCQANIDNTIAHYHTGKKYIRVDVGNSGRYMIDMEGNIWGIKAYGVIHKGHHYGTLDTIDLYYWGQYTAFKK